MCPLPDREFTDQELHRLLDEIDRYNEEKIVPLSAEEVAEIEASYTPRTLSPERDERQRQHLEDLRRAVGGWEVTMNSIWRWLYNVAGRDFGGTPAAPNDGAHSPEFVSRQHGMSTGVEWFSASFSNDAADFWVACKWTDEETSTWHSVMAAEDFRKIALWYLWRWAWGEWFGLRRRLWYAALRRICADRR